MSEVESVKANVGNIPSISGFGVEKEERGVLWPTVDPNFFVPSDIEEVLDVIQTLSGDLPQNVLVTGPQGQGKSELGIWFAAKYHRPCIIMNCATIRETKDWFGYKDAKQGSIYWHQSDFVRALRNGNCVVILDEFNRLHTTLHNGLYPLLDARRASFVEELEEILRVSPGTIFFATANIGFSHVGTHTFDAALEDRFGFRIEVSFPSQDKEITILMKKTGISLELATRLTQFGKDIRRKAASTAGATLSRIVSTRQLLQTAILMKEFGKRKVDIRKALDFTILPFYSKEGGSESEQSQVLQLVQGIFPPGVVV